MRTLCRWLCLLLVLLALPLCLTALADETEPPPEPAPAPTESTPAPPEPTEPAPPATGAPTDPAPPATEAPTDPAPPVTEASKDPAPPVTEAPTEPPSSEPAPGPAPTAPPPTEPAPPQPTQPVPTRPTPTQPVPTEPEETEPDYFDPDVKNPAPPELPADGEVENRDEAGRLCYAIPETWTAGDVVAWFIAEYGLDSGCFAVSFYCPDTGERFDWNADTFMLAASTYKLPLNMYYYEQERAGVYTDDTIVMDRRPREEGQDPAKAYTLAEAHYQSLVWSANDESHALIYNLGSFYTYKRLMLERYSGLTREDLTLDYWTGNYYNTRFMCNVLTYLYEHLEEFGQLRDYLLQAMPNHYLKKYSGDVPVAHKYGNIDGHYHDVGIVFTEQPFLTAIYTYNVYGVTGRISGEELIGRLGLALIAYQTQRTELDKLHPPQPTEPETSEPPETEPLPEDPTAEALTEPAPETGPQQETEAVPAIDTAPDAGQLESGQGAGQQPEAPDLSPAAGASAPDGPAPGPDLPNGAPAAESPAGPNSDPAAESPADPNGDPAAESPADPNSDPASDSSARPGAATPKAGTPWYFIAFPAVILCAALGAFLLFRKRR